MNKLNFQKAICIIDGSALVYRAFYAIKPLTNSQGEQTHAIMGFFKSLIKTVEKFQTTELDLIIAWDSKESSRKEIYADYKATRAAMPDGLGSQFDAIKKICTKAEIKQLFVSGLEADDLIFSCTEQASLPVIVVSPDKDLLQLVKGSNFVYDPTTDVLYDTDKVVEKYEIPPENLKLYYALLGDASDNIPGVSGIGKKTALEIAKLFVNPEELVANVDLIPTKHGNKIIADKDNLFLSFKLFCLINTPLDKEIFTAIPFKVEDLLKAQDLFQHFEIKSIFNKKLTAKLEPEKNIDPEAYNWFEYKKVESSEDLAVLLNSTVVGVDTETTGLDWKTDRIVALTISDGSNSFFVDVQTQQFTEILKWLDDNIFSNEKITKVLHNAKFDIHFLRQLGAFKKINNIFDTLICAHIIFKGSASEKINLKALAKKYFGLNLPSYKELFSTTKKELSGTPEDNLFEKYAVCDALVCLKLYHEFSKVLSGSALELFRSIEIPLMEILTTMEESGISIDRNAMDQIDKKVTEQLQEVEEKLRSHLESLGYQQHQEINFLSPKQVGELLFGFLNLDRFLSINSQPSTDKETLDHLSKFHPVPKLISHLRALSKLKSTYLEGFQKHIWTDGKIHTNYSQTNVATGRLASESPNLQNLPLDLGDNDPLSFGYRSIFVPDTGKTLVSCDYSQIELRVLAHVTQDPILIQAFTTGQDIHSTTAKEIFKLDSIDQVTNTQRQVGKKINFGIVYGLGGFGLSQQLEIPKGLAQEYIDSFFEKYKVVKQWIENTHAQAKENGFVETIFGRKRILEQINDRNAILRKASERMAVNSIIQGSAAEIVKIAMIKINQIIKDKYLDKAQMLLQIHDELVFQVESSMLDQFKETVQKAMETAVQLNIPLEVSASHGENLKDLN